MSWSNTDELLLGIVRMLQLWRYEWVLVHTDPEERRSVLEPVLVQRPWEQPEQGSAPGSEPVRMSTRQEIRAFFGAANGATKIVVSPG